MEMTEKERIRSINIDLQKLPKLKKRQKLLREKMNRLLGTCVSILKGLTFMPLGSPRKKRKKYLRKNVQFSKFGKKKINLQNKEIKYI